MITTENNVAAQAGDEPMRENLALVIARLEQIAGNFTYDYRNAAEEALVCARSIAAQVSPRATADVERENLPHGHREDFYLMANARSLAMKPVHCIKSMPNWVLAKELFATGSTSAHEICVRAGIDPDGYHVERATTKPGA